jgi:hypothetical protein
MGGQEFPSTQDNRHQEEEEEEESEGEDNESALVSTKQGTYEQQYPCDYLFQQEEPPVEYRLL